MWLWNIKKKNHIKVLWNYGFELEEYDTMCVCVCVCVTRVTVSVTESTWVCVCVCVCVRERELGGGGGGDKEREMLSRMKYICKPATMEKLWLLAVSKCTVKGSWHKHLQKVHGLWCTDGCQDDLSLYDRSDSIAFLLLSFHSTPHSDHIHTWNRLKTTMNVDWHLAVVREFSCNYQQ